MSNISQWLLNKYYPIQTHPFHDLLSKSIADNKIILDAGCGNGKIYQYSFKERTKLIVGLDLRSDIADNQQIHTAIQASVLQLPFVAQTFDLVFSRFVLEHLERPEISFFEFARVLKPGGKLLILTPNFYHYFALAGRIIPHSLQNFIAGLSGYKEQDIYKTYYRANTEKSLIILGKNAGLLVEHIQFYEPSPYFLSFSPFTLAPAILYERLINNIKLFDVLRAHIIIIFRNELSA